MTLPRLFLSSLLLLTACGPATDEAADPGVSQAALTDAQEIQALKAQIRAIASANTERTDNYAEVAAELRPLVDQLVALARPRTPEQTATKLKGTWRQLWSNLEIGRPGLRTDLTRVYQVVTKDGYYYNYSQLEVGGQLISSALRGQYAPIPEGFAIEFTRTGVIFGALPDDLRKLTEDIESGQQPLIALGPSQAPFGPVGITGILTTLYVDDDLRIAGGQSNPYTDAAGNVLVPGDYNLLFVLDKDK